MRKSSLSRFAVLTAFALVLCALLLWPALRPRHRTTTIRKFSRAAPSMRPFAKPGATNDIADIQVKRQPPEPIEEMPRPRSPRATASSGSPAIGPGIRPRRFHLDQRRLAHPPRTPSGNPATGARRRRSGAGCPATGRAQRQRWPIARPRPETLEAGPNSDAPGTNYVWAPGCWITGHDRYGLAAGGAGSNRPRPRFMSPPATADPAATSSGRLLGPCDRNAAGYIFAPVTSGRRLCRPAFVYTPTVIIERRSS